MDAILDRIDKAETSEALAELDIETKELLEREKMYLLRFLENRKSLLMERSQKNGTYFADAKDIWKIEATALPDHPNMDSFNHICRPDTYELYNYIKETAAKERKKSASNELYEPCLSTQGTNSQFPKNDRDMFNNPWDSCKAHIFLDSKSCAPAWGLVAEGATGKIVETDEKRKNKIRLLRMMGPNSAEKKNCLRRDVHNYLPLDGSHSQYYDKHPQLLIIPILSLDKIKSWDPKESYDVLVLGVSNEDTGKNAAEVYRKILSHFDWDSFNEDWDDSGKNPAVCEPEEIEMTFERLGEFTKALAHTFELGIPEELLKLATGKDDINYKKKNSSSTSNPGEDTKKSKKGKRKGKARDLGHVQENEELKSPSEGYYSAADEDVWWDTTGLHKKLKKLGVLLPKRKKGGLGRVLKIRMDGETLPDPWLLMVKAAVNFSYIEYGIKLLAACKPLPYESNLQYEEALQRHERRVRQQDIPMVLSVPTSPIDHPGIIKPRVVTPPVVTPPDKKKIEDDDWEYFSD